MSGDDRQNSPSISRQNRPSATVILLTPVRMNLKDGGSVRYKALVYEVTKIHRLAPEVDGVKPYIDGFEIKILGMTVYRETNE